MIQKIQRFFWIVVDSFFFGIFLNFSASSQNAAKMRTNSDKILEKIQRNVAKYKEKKKRNAMLPERFYSSDAYPESKF